MGTEDYLMGTECPFWKILEMDRSRAGQCECTPCSRTVHLKVAKMVTSVNQRVYTIM